MFHKGILHKINDSHWTITVKENTLTNSYNFTTETIQSLVQTNNFLQWHNHLISQKGNEHLNQLNATIETISKKPRLRIFDHPLSSWSKETSFTYDQLRRSFGFRNISKLLPVLRETCEPNFHISTFDAGTIVDIGTTATVDKSKRNTAGVPLPSSFGDAMQVDIIFGSRTSINSIKYSLFIADRATRYKTILPLENFTADILFQLQKFCKEIGFVPRKFISDCDNKLFSLTIQQWLVANNSSITVAPANATGVPS